MPHFLRQPSIIHLMNYATICALVLSLVACALSRAPQSQVRDGVQPQPVGSSVFADDFNRPDRTVTSPLTSTANLDSLNKVNALGTDWEVLQTTSPAAYHNFEVKNGAMQIRPNNPLVAYSFLRVKAPPIRDVSQCVTVSPKNNNAGSFGLFARRSADGKSYYLAEINANGSFGTFISIHRYANDISKSLGFTTSDNFVFPAKICFATTVDSVSLTANGTILLEATDALLKDPGAFGIFSNTTMGWKADDYRSDGQAPTPAPITILTNDAKKIAAYTNKVAAVRIVPNQEELLLSGASDQSVKLINWVTGNTLWELPTDSWGGMVQTSQDGKFAVVTGASEARVVSMETGATLHEFEGLLGIGGGVRALSIAFAADGKLVAIAFGGYVGLWATETGKLVSYLTKAGMSPTVTTTENMFNAATSVAMTPDGKWIMVLESGKLLGFRLDTGELAKTYPLPALGDPAGVGVLALSRDARFVAYSRGQRVGIISTESGNLLVNIRASTDSLTDVAFATDACCLVTSSLSGETAIWDMASGVKKAQLIDPGTTAGQFQVKFSSLSAGSGAKVMASGDIEGNLWVWKVDLPSP